MVKPQAKVVSKVCSLCGLDWKRHGKDPTAETCIRLLLDEVRSLNAQLATRPYVRPYVYPIPWARPYNPFPYQPYWGNQTVAQGSQLSATSYTPAANAGRPRAINAV